MAEFDREKLIALCFEYNNVETRIASAVGFEAKRLGMSKLQARELCWGLIWMFGAVDATGSANNMARAIDDAFFVDGFEKAEKS